MTLLPTENRRVVGIEGASRYELNQICAVPQCFERATDAHHCFRRSAIGNDSWVVRLDSHPLRHVVGLCRKHHHLVTENLAWVRLEDDDFIWYAETGLSTPDFFSAKEWDRFGPLDPQPGEIEKRELAPGSECPRCKRKLPAPFKGEKKRTRQTWSIRAPKDAGEDGIEILESLTEQAADKLGKAGEPPYYVLVAALYFFVSNFTPDIDVA